MYKMGQVGSSQANNMVLPFMSGDSYTHTEIQMISLDV